MSEENDEAIYMAFLLVQDTWGVNSTAAGVADTLGGWCAVYYERGTLLMYVHLHSEEQEWCNEIPEYPYSLQATTTLRTSEV